MEAASRVAASEGGTVLGILPDSEVTNIASSKPLLLALQISLESLAL